MKQKSRANHAPAQSGLYPLCGVVGKSLWFASGVPRFFSVATLLAISSVLRVLGAAGDLDPAFNPNASGGVYCTAIQPDQKILVGGYFGAIAGAGRNGLARLNADGSLDGNFTPKFYVSASVYGIGVQDDGKIVVAGYFTTVDGPRFNLARLNANGSLDSTFRLDANGPLYAMALQPDGKIIIGGDAVKVGGIARDKIARLNPDGTVDLSFNPGADSRVLSIALQADGKILVGGTFHMIGQATRNYLARLNPDGSVDSAFDAKLSSDFYGADLSSVACIAAQVDGKILIAGGPQQLLVRLNTDGGLDTNFVYRAGAVSSILLQTDGKIVIDGTVANADFSGLARTALARLNLDGTLDTSMPEVAITKTVRNSPAVGNVSCVGLQSDGQFLIGGDSFDHVGGIARNNLARLLNDAAVESLIIPHAGRLEWRRGGSAPEVQNAVFELSNDAGATWTKLGMGSRIAGGWELAGLSLPSSGLVRVRGSAVSGQAGASSGLIERVTSLALSTIPSPQLTSVARVGNASFQFGFSSAQGESFTVLATTNLGTSPIQWIEMGPATELGGGQYQFTDSINFPYRFYRVQVR